MKFIAVGTLVLVLGSLCGGSHPQTEGPGVKGLPKDGSACSTLVKDGLGPCRKIDEGGLKDLPKLIDLKGVKTSLETPTNDTIKTVERKVFNNTDATGRDTGNKTVVEKTTETDVKPNGTVSKITETKVVVDEEGKERGEKSVTESETVTESSADNGTVAQTVDVKKVMDEEGKEIDEEVVIKKELKAKPLSRATEEKPKVGAADKGTNKTESKLVASGKSGEREEETKKTLNCTNTKEVIVKEKEEKLPSQDSIKVKSVESKNVTDKEDGKDVEKETVIEKEVKKNVCSGDTTQVDVKNKIKEEKAKAGEVKVTPGLRVVQKSRPGPALRRGIVVKKVFRVMRPVKVVKRVVPGPGKGRVVVRVVKRVTPTVVVKRVPVVRQMKVAEQAPPTLPEGNVTAFKEEKVIAKAAPSVTEGKLPVVAEEKVVEQAAPSVTEELVSVPRKQEELPVVAEKVVEQAAPSVTEMVSVPKEQELPAVTKEVVEQAAPSLTEETVSVPKEQEVPVVAEEKVVEETIPSAAEEKIPVVVERVAPAAKESVVAIPKGEEGVLERIAPVVKKELTTE